MTIVGQVAQMALVRTKSVNGYEIVLDSLQLTPSFGPIFYTGLDIGTPGISAVSTPFSNASGTFNQTKYTRDRSIAISLLVIDNWFDRFKPSSLTWTDTEKNSASYWIEEVLAGWCAPNCRGYLYIQFAGPSQPTYRIDIVGNGMTQPIGQTDRQSRNVQLNLVSPKGLLRKIAPAAFNVSNDGRTVAQVPFDPSTTSGPTFPVTFPFTFGTDVLGAGTVIPYNGTAPTGFLARIYAVNGPIYQPKLVLTQTDQSGNVLPPVSLGFQSGTVSVPLVVTIPDGQYLEIDTENMAINLIGPGTKTNLEQYVLGPLRWPKLQKGSVKINLATNLNADGTNATAPGTGSYGEILYYPSYV